MTDIDLRKPDKEVIEADNIELIKEARAKIKPVIKAMSDEEVNAICMTLEEAKEDKELMINRPEFYQVLERVGITLEELRKIQDKHYEVDIEYELTRDLYEKQRVIDNYLVEHKEDDQLLNQYYSNHYFKARLNKQKHLVYYLPYSALSLRTNYRMMWFTTTLAAGCLAMIHPALSLLLGYEYFLLLKALRVMNQTTNLILLDTTKRHVLLSKLNFLGYETKPKQDRVSLQSIKYMGEYENTAVTMDNAGLLPSFAKYMRSTESDEEAKDNFRFFHKFMANNEIYLVAKDHSAHREFCPSDALLMSVIKAKQKAVLDFDFSEMEAEAEKKMRERDEVIREILDFKQVDYIDKEAQKRRAYSPYHPNREFEGNKEHMKLKKIDDGTFVDNGYR